MNRNTHWMSMSNCLVTYISLWRNMYTKPHFSALFFFLSEATSTSQQQVIENRMKRETWQSTGVTQSIKQQHAGIDMYIFFEYTYSVALMNSDWLKYVEKIERERIKLEPLMKIFFISTSTLLCYLPWVVDNYSLAYCNILNILRWLHFTP